MKLILWSNHQTFIKKELWTPIADENELSPFTRADPGINNILKPEDVHDGGNMILRESGGNITENTSGKLSLLSNLPMERLFAHYVGSSFSVPMVTNIIGKIANKYLNGSANLLKNLLLPLLDYLKLKMLKGLIPIRRSYTLAHQVTVYHTIRILQRSLIKEQFYWMKLHWIKQDSSLFY